MAQCPEADERLLSPRNPRVKAAVSLQRRRDRDRSGRMLIEGARELSRALRCGHAVETVFFCPACFSAREQAGLLQALRESGATLFELSLSAFERLSYRQHPDGLVGVAGQVGVALSSLVAEDPVLFLVAEAIEKPGNLGALLRSADGAGADAVIVCDPGTDLSNPNVVRASLGTVFAVPTATASTEEVQRFLRDREVRVVTASPDAERLYWDVDLTAPLALVIGTEHAGLSPAWRAMPEAVPVRLPMAGGADSLNAATAATVLLYEAVRQRQAASHEPLGDGIGTRDQHLPKEN